MCYETTTDKWLVMKPQFDFFRGESSLWPVVFHLLIYLSSFIVSEVEILSDFKRELQNCKSKASSNATVSN